MTITYVLDSIVKGKYVSSFIHIRMKNIFFVCLDDVHQKQKKSL